MCSHHDVDELPTDLKVDVASKAYQSYILKLIPDKGCLTEDFSSQFIKFKDSHDLSKEEHFLSVAIAVEALANKGYIAYSKTEKVYQISITEIGEAKKKSLLNKVLSVFSN